METQDIQRRRSEPDVGEAALVMAVGIVVERVSRLSAADKTDLFELVKGLGAAQDAEEYESIRSAMLEILDQEQTGAQVMESDALARRPEKLQKWVDYISGKIRDLRKAAKLTQEELAGRSGLPQSHISRLEKGQHSPSRETLEKLAKGLGVPVGQLDPSA